MGNKITPHKLFEIYQDKRRIYTKSIVPGKSPFQEKLFKQEGEEFREFDPRRSKLAAMIMKGCTNIGIRKGDVILYLGVSHGYTASFVSDIIGKEGILFGVDPAPRVVRDLVFLTEDRPNIVPLLTDANHPDTYVQRVLQADIVFQDIAQRNQLQIFVKNCELFLKKGGYGLLAVKARSIDIKRKPKELFIEIRKELEKKYKVLDYKVLDPFEKDHCMIIIKKQ